MLYNSLTKLFSCHPEIFIKRSEVKISGIQEKKLRVVDMLTNPMTIFYCHPELVSGSLLFSRTWLSKRDAETSSA